MLLIFHSTASEFNSRELISPKSHFLIRDKVSSVVWKDALMGLKFSVEKGHIFYPQEAWLNIFLCMDNTTNVHNSEQLLFCSHRPQAILHHPQKAFSSFSPFRSSLIPSSLWIEICISLLLKRTDPRLQNLLESLSFRNLGIIPETEEEHLCLRMDS